MEPNSPNKVLVEESSPRRELHLLVVEDSSELRTMLRLFLESFGHRVCIVEDMASALQVAEEQSFDVLLCDILLPDGNGCELLRRLTAGGRRPPLALAMSCHSQRWDLVTSELAGFAKHLIKPFLPGALEQALAEYARQKAERSAIDKAAPSAAETCDAPSTKSPRIIVVDDYSSSLQTAINLVRATLPAAEIVATETDQEAWHAFQQGGADFVVTNHRPPEIDGVALIRRVRAKRPQLAIAMISAKLAARTEAMAAGANWFVHETDVAELLPELLRTRI